MYARPLVQLVLQAVNAVLATIVLIPDTADIVQMKAATVHTTETAVWDILVI